MTIICYDTDVKVEKKPVVLSVQEKRLPRRRHPFKLITRTNGRLTEYICVNWCGVVTHKYTETCSPEDRYDYEQDVKVENKRNDKLMKDANNAFNLLLNKGYLYKKRGVTGFVREVDEASARIFVNTEYNSEVICALLKLYFPNRKWEIL